MVEHALFTPEGTVARGDPYHSRYFPKGTGVMDEPMMVQVHPRRACSLWNTPAGAEDVGGGKSSRHKCPP